MKSVISSNLGHKDLSGGVGYEIGCLLGAAQWNPIIYMVGNFHAMVSHGSFQTP